MSVGTSGSFSNSSLFIFFLRARDLADPIASCGFSRLTTRHRMPQLRVSGCSEVVPVAPSALMQHTARRLTLVINEESYCRSKGLKWPPFLVCVLGLWSKTWDTPSMGHQPETDSPCCMITGDFSGDFLGESPSEPVKPNLSYTYLRL